MRLKIEDDRITITLSRRNLLAGLHKLDMVNSAREIQKSEGDRLLCLKFEDDAEHYTHPDRDGPVGGMHPDTERFIKEATS